MAGGLLNLVSSGQTNIILNGNPSMSFWKKSYAKYTNFGLQRFRLDYDGTPSLRLTEQSTFNFKVKRYADLLCDTYIAVSLPNIWSPIFPPQTIVNPDGSTTITNWSPYNFKWIENLGSQIISNITIHCGNSQLQSYSGAYLLAAMQRDFTAEKRALYNEMTGNTAKFNNPAYYETRNGHYPNSFFTENPAGVQPSITAQTIYIPLGAWFTQMTQSAFPLVSLQYNELNIHVTFRPINEWFQIRNVTDYINNFPYVAPNFNQYYMQFYRFLQPPPDINIGATSYTDTRTLWNADIHLECTYCFLSNVEQATFAAQDKSYLMRTIREVPFYNVTGQNKISLDSTGTVIDWMFYFQRSDANLRNEWSNYTNWAYKTMPSDITIAPPLGIYANPSVYPPAFIGPGMNPNGTISGIYLSDIHNISYTRDILTSLGILLDGQYRENMLQSGVYNYIEKYCRTAGNAPDGLYCYNYCLNTSPLIYQPSGSMNMSRFTNINFEFSTIVPPYNPYAQVLTICDPESGELVGINKPTWQIYEYNYNLIVFEERINMVNFIGGNCGLLYSL